MPYDSGSGFSSKTIQETMLFFLLIQFAIQIFAWSIILGNLAINDPERKGRTGLRDIEEETKNETNVPSYLIKVIYLEVYNSFILLSYALKNLPNVF